MRLASYIRRRNSVATTCTNTDGCVGRNESSTGNGQCANRPIDEFVTLTALELNVWCEGLKGKVSIHYRGTYLCCFEEFRCDGRRYLPDHVVCDGR